MAVLDGGVEESQEPVVFLLSDRVELVVVTLRAPESQSKESRAGGVDPVHDRFDAKLLRVDAAFLIDLRVAMEAGRDLLVESRLRQQVARELLDGELVE